MLRFVEFSPFTHRLYELLDDEEYRLLQHALLANPYAGSVIPGTGGVRKLRWAGSGRGKRGGVRVVYYIATSAECFLMIFIYAKNEQEELTSRQKRLLQAVLLEKG